MLLPDDAVVMLGSAAAHARPASRRGSGRWANTTMRPTAGTESKARRTHASIGCLKTDTIALPASPKCFAKGSIPGRSPAGMIAIHFAIMFRRAQGKPH